MSNDIMAFRLAYLRAIARAWQDPPFFEELVKEPNVNVFDILASEFNFF